MNTDNTAAPGARFNYAAWLLELNRDRGQKTAYIDDRGTLSYAELDTRVRTMAQALLDAGIRREERVLLLMHDCNDWPVAFLGAIYAGIVPVAVNTLLTADDYVYMLQHSRARAALVSNALLGPLRGAMNAASHNVTSVFVSGADDQLQAGEQDLETVLQTSAPLSTAADTIADDIGFWLYSSGSTRPSCFLPMGWAMRCLFPSA